MKAVLFDVDDTLYDQVVPFENAYKAVFGDAYDVSCQELFVASRKHSDTVFEKSQNNEISMRDMYVYRISNAFKDFGIIITEQQALDFQALYSDGQRSIEVTDQIKKTLYLLKQNGVRLGIITNGPSDHQRAKIKSLCLQYWIKYDSIFVSGDFTFSKPDIRIFECAEKALRLDKNDIWYVGDSYNNDVVGAKQAGWNCIWFNRRKHEQPETNAKPNYIVGDEESLHHLVGILLKRQGTHCGVPDKRTVNGYCKAIQEESYD